MVRKKVVNELNLNKEQEFERLSAHLKVTGEVKKLVIGQPTPWEEDVIAELPTEPEQLEEKIRSVELPKKMENLTSLGVIQIIRQVGNMKIGHQVDIIRIDDSGRIYFMNGDMETYFDPSEKGRLFVTVNKE